MCGSPGASHFSPAWLPCVKWTARLIRFHPLLPSSCAYVSRTPRCALGPLCPRAPPVVPLARLPCLSRPPLCPWSSTPRIFTACCRSTHAAHLLSRARILHGATRISASSPVCAHSSVRLPICVYVSHPSSASSTLTTYLLCVSHPPRASSTLTT